MKFFNNTNIRKTNKSTHMIQAKSQGVQMEKGECCVAAAIIVMIKLFLEENF